MTEEDSARSWIDEIICSLSFLKQQRRQIFALQPLVYRYSLLTCAVQCFLNSVTQCLSNTRCLLEYMVREGFSGDINTSVLSTMKGDLIRGALSIPLLLTFTNIN